MVQWLELHVEGSIPCWGTKIHQPKKKKRKEKSYNGKYCAGNAVAAPFNVVEATCLPMAILAPKN